MRYRIPAFYFILSLLIVTPIPSDIAFAVDENDLLDRIDEINQVYESGVHGVFQAEDGIHLHYSYFDSETAQACIVVLPGRTEMRRKYAEFIFDLLQKDYCIFIKDWRGQGQSERLLNDSEKGHITDYQVYINDLDQFLGEVVRPLLNGRPLYGLAHSMGANILSLYAAEEPEAFDKIVFSAPMLDIPTAGIPQRLLWLVLRGLEILGFGDSYVMTHGPFNPDEKNYVTTSRVRRQVEMAMKKKNRQEVVAGATNSWVRASFEATWAMKDRARDIRVPVLMLQAGRDEVVLSEGQDYVCASAKNCRKEVFPEAKHEILMEVDSVRQRALAMIFGFFK